MNIEVLLGIRWKCSCQWSSGAGRTSKLWSYSQI